MNIRILVSIILIITNIASTLAETPESLIRKAIGDIKAQVGVALIIDGKDTLTVNNDAEYPLMSVFKFHQSLAVAHYLHSHNLPLTTEIFIPQEALLPDTYSPLRDEYPQGNLRMSVERLLEYTLQMSDNNACDILFRYIGGVEHADSYLRTLGTKHFQLSQTEDEMHKDLNNCYRNWSTPLEAVRLIEIFLSQELFPATYSEFIKRTMLECETGKNRLPKPLLGTSVRIGHKTGTGDRNVQGKLIGINDIGFVMLPDGHRYTIAVLIKDSSESMERTEKAIADISEAMYQYITRQYIR